MNMGTRGVAILGTLDVPMMVHLVGLVWDRPKNERTKIKQVRVEYLEFGQRGEEIMGGRVMKG